MVAEDTSVLDRRQALTVAIALARAASGPTARSARTGSSPRAPSGILGRVSAPSPALRRRAKARKALTIALFCIMPRARRDRRAAGAGPLRRRLGRPVLLHDHRPRVALREHLHRLRVRRADPRRRRATSATSSCPPTPRSSARTTARRTTTSSQAVLEVPPASAADALTALQDSFGTCVKNHPSPLVRARPQVALHPGQRPGRRPQTGAPTAASTSSAPPCAPTGPAWSTSRSAPADGAPAPRTRRTPGRTHSPDVPRRARAARLRAGGAAREVASPVTSGSAGGGTLDVVVVVALDPGHQVAELVADGLDRLLLLLLATAP